MEKTLMQDLKKQASFFLKEKIKIARLVLMDATPVQLLTEEILTNDGESFAQDTYAMRIISRAAFEVDEYDRIVHILHHRLCEFNVRNWRGSYKALVVLEHLLTHGPLRVAEEFQSALQTIAHMATFHYVDHKGFDWGMRMKEKSERITSLLEDKSYLKEERAKARKLSMGIKGFGSFNIDRISKSISTDHHQKLAILDEHKKTLLLSNNKEHVMEEDHPFWDIEAHTTKSLLSAI